MHDVASQVFVITLIGGLLLIGAEIFLPGGVLGVFAVLCLIVSIIAAFASPLFTNQQALLMAFGILALSVISMVLWMKLFPKTKAGGKLTLKTDLADAKAQEPGLDELIGKEGVAVTDLKPSGIAMIDNHRIDVITQGEMIDKGKPIFVIDVNANRVIVKPTG